MKGLFCKHRYKRIRVIKEEYFPHMPPMRTWLHICEKCGKEKKVKEG